MVGIIHPAVISAEIERTRRKRTNNLDAYDVYLRGWWYTHQISKIDQPRALHYFDQATHLDPDFASAYSAIAWSHFISSQLGWSPDPVATREAGLKAAQRAIHLDSRDAQAHAVLAACRLSLRDHRTALSEADRAIALNQNLLMAHAMRGVIVACLGRPKEGIESANKALSLSPLDPLRAVFVNALVMSQYEAGDYRAATDTAAELIALQGDYLWGHVNLAISSAQLGDNDTATQALNNVYRIEPGFDQQFLDSVALFISGSAPWSHFLEGLRKAGWEG